MDEVAFMDVLITANNFFFKFFNFTSDGGYLIACFSASNSNKQNQNWNQHLHCSRESYPTILIQRSSEDSHFNPTVLPNSHEKHRDSLKRRIPPPNITET